MKEDTADTGDDILNLIQRVISIPLSKVEQKSFEAIRAFGIWQRRIFEDDVELPKTPKPF